MKLELVFPASGQHIPTDHSYPLYSALSAVVPQFHDAASGLRFAAITGEPDGAGHLRLADHSCLRVRVADDAIRTVLPLAGKRLEIAGHAVRLGVSSVRTLIPAPRLFARIVTFKNNDDPEKFLETARGKLAEMGVTAEPELPIHITGDRAGEPHRKIVRVKGVAIVGYSLLVSELTADDSLKLQTHGLGGRTQMGCGFFVPFREAK